MAAKIYKVNIIPAYDLAVNADRASAGIILTQCPALYHGPHCTRGKWKCEC